MYFYNLFFQELSVLYLDNTYAAPSCKFPSREDALKEVLKIIEYVHFYNIFSVCCKFHDLLIKLKLLTITILVRILMQKF